MSEDIVAGARILTYGLIDVDMMAAMHDTTTNSLECNMVFGADYVDSWAGGRWPKKREIEIGGKITFLILRMYVRIILSKGARGQTCLPSFSKRAKRLTQLVYGCAAARGVPGA